MTRRPPRRDGYVMVLLAMLLLGLFAMAALVIDLGFARLAQRQMQTAADAAALEGLRGEGITPYEDRQAAAEQLIAWTFDDDLDVAGGDDGIAGNGGAFGAGPIVRFSGGAGTPSLNASQLMTVDPDNTAYKPIMLRRSSPVTTNEFLVAIQRGGVVDREYDLLAAGPSVPYLFARGSFIDRERVGAGIFTGGEARAEARPVVRVWPAVASVLGVQPIAYALENWNASPTNPVAITSNLTDGLRIGETIVTETFGATPTVPTSGYCVIFDSDTDRAIGFGMLGQTSPETGIVGSQNVSARLSDAWDVLSTLSPTDRETVLASNRSLMHALKAPVLVRN